MYTTNFLFFFKENDVGKLVCVAVAIRIAFVRIE
mgnify:CR=1 FL=1